MNFAAVLELLRAVRRRIMEKLDATRYTSRHRAKEGAYACRRAARWVRWFRAADPGYSKSIPASGPHRRTDDAAETAEEKERHRQASDLAARQLACYLALSEKKRARETRQRLRGGKGVHGEDSAQAEAVSRFLAQRDLNL